tara:strand:+ start:1789 stop:2472 length:684 start_codon:yes stop_codon:yes gene_type:complete
MIDWKILFKLPSRERPSRVFEVMDAAVDNLLQKENNFSFLLSLDEDDKTMNNTEVIEKLNTYPNTNIVFGVSDSKVDAINRDMETLKDWDIVVLLSDDMVPVLFGFDEVIRKAYKTHFPDLDGVTWFNDGFQGQKINTLCILGRPYYDRFGYIYHPDYKSLYCDNEFTNVATKLGKQKYIPTVIIEHRHFSIGNNSDRYDPLYVKNDALMKRDEQVFWSRHKNNYEL